MANQSVLKLADVDVFDPDGKTVRMGSLWEQGPILLALVRHFGCIFCKEQVTELATHRPRIQAAGGELIILGNGGPEHAKWFIEDYNITVPVLTDPSLQSHSVLGVKTGSLLDPRPILLGAKAFFQGHRQSKTRGPAALNGGVFVVTQDNEMPYQYISKFAGDHPDPEAPIKALEKSQKRTGVAAVPA